MLVTLSVLDIISLIILIVIALIVLKHSLSGDQSPMSAAGRSPSLTGGAPLEPERWFRDDSPTDTNDPVLLLDNIDSRYLGPDQAALAMAMLDDSQHFGEVTGHIPADLSMFLDHSAFPGHLGSNDPAALGSLVLLDPTAHFAEEVLDDPPHPALPMLRGLAIALIVLALLYRLIFF